MTLEDSLCKAKMITCLMKLLGAMEYKEMMELFGLYVTWVSL
jgi:hypothetical protein